MLRILLAVIVLLLYLLLSLPVLLVLWIVRRFTPRATFAMQKFACVFLRVIQAISGARVQTKGLENVPTNEPVLFVANHQSFFDVVIGLPQLTKLGIPLTYIAKVAFKKYPVFNLSLMFLRCPFIDRSDLKQSIAAIKDATAMIDEGLSIFVFPEGERNRTGEYPLLPFFDGAFSIAKRKNIPIVPVAYSGTAALLENHFPLLKAGDVTVEYGKAVSFSDLSAEEKKHAGAYFEKVIAEMVRKNIAP